MKIEDVRESDIEQICRLQPQGWTDIRPTIEFYVKSSYCRLMKVETQNTIIGIGAHIRFEHTAWLAHIIVNPDYRRQGVGRKITEWLVSDLERSDVQTISLIASDMGRPLYSKLGFREEIKYAYLRNGKEMSESLDVKSDVCPISDTHENQIMYIDRQATGEERTNLLKPFLKDGFVYQIGKEIHGFFLPSLGEGLIVAQSDVAGTELLKLKCRNCNSITLPIITIAGINLLRNIGYSEFQQASRMVLGKNLDFKPQCIFSRIGGNFG